MQYNRFGQKRFCWSHLCSCYLRNSRTFKIGEKIRVKFPKDLFYNARNQSFNLPLLQIQNVKENLQTYADCWSDSNLEGHLKREGKPNFRVMLLRLSEVLFCKFIQDEEEEDDIIFHDVPSLVKSFYCHFTKPVFEVYVIISRSSQLACNHNSAGLFSKKYVFKIHI